MAIGFGRLYFLLLRLFFKLLLFTEFAMLSTVAVVRFPTPRPAYPDTPIKGNAVANFKAFIILLLCVDFKSDKNFFLSFFFLSLDCFSALVKSAESEESFSAFPFGTYCPVAASIFLIPDQLCPKAFLPKFPIPKACACTCFFLSVPVDNEDFKSFPNSTAPAANPFTIFPAALATNSFSYISDFGSEPRIVPKDLEPPSLSPTILNIPVNISEAFSIKFITINANTIPAIDSFVSCSTTVTKHV